MKYKLLVLLCIAVRPTLFSQSLTYGRQIYYKIASVYNFKKAILSLTFDDGAPTQFSIAVPLLNERNIPSTFYIITRDLVDSSFCNKLIDSYHCHHEIASHTIHHFQLSSLKRSELTTELQGSRDAINSLLKGNNCLTIAYPGGLYNDSVLEVSKKYYFAGRSGIQGFNDINSFNRYLLKGKTYMRGIGIYKFKDYVKYALKEGLWLIEIFHGIENEGYEPISTKDFIYHLEYIKSQEHNLWYSTVSNVIKYLDEKNSVKIFCDSCDDEKSFKIRLEDNLNDSIYGHPLSISMKIPNNWDEVTVSGAQLVKTVSNDGNKFLLFNALPNNKEIVLKPKFIKASTPENSTKIIDIEPIPFNDYIDVSFETNKLSTITVILRNLYGKIIDFKNVECNVINFVRINTTETPKGFYIVELINRTTNETLTKKLVKLY